MPVSHWRRKPVVVEAWQFMPAGQREELPPWIDARWFYEDRGPGNQNSEPGSRPYMLIPMPGGTLRADLTDWIIRSVKGDVYPCKADVFAATYEPA
jgi:hypothetical protein